MIHHPRKRFGQHFLHDAGVLRRILEAVAPRPGDRLVEIGPGEGALTKLLVKHLDRLDVIELDRDLAAALAARLDNPAGLTVHQSDALTFDFTSLAGPDRLRIVGNLPYNISTPLLFHLFEHASRISDMHFMLQREVADRLTAEPGTRAYGRLSVMAGFHCRMQRLFIVGSGAFRPPPKVESALVRLVPRKLDAATTKLLPKLDEVVRRAFNQRRKILRNSLDGLLDQAAIQSAGIDPGLRPEQLPLEGFLALAGKVK